MDLLEITDGNGKKREKCGRKLSRKEQEELGSAIASDIHKNNLHFIYYRIESDIEHVLSPKSEVIENEECPLELSLDEGQQGKKVKPNQKDGFFKRSATICNGLVKRGSNSTPSPPNSNSCNSSRSSKSSLYPRLSIDNGIECTEPDLMLDFDRISQNSSSKKESLSLLGRAAPGEGGGEGSRADRSISRSMSVCSDSSLHSLNRQMTLSLGEEACDDVSLSAEEETERDAFNSSLKDHLSTALVQTVPNGSPRSLAKKFVADEEDSCTESFRTLNPFSYAHYIEPFDEGKRERLYKILVVGEIGTGKTSMIKRYVHQFFSQHYRATIGVDFALKVLRWDSDTVVRLQLWDVAGQERFGSMTRVYYKEAVGAFVVFDVTRSSTLEAVPKWKADLDSKVVLPDGRPIPTVLLANKSDMPKEGIAGNREKMNEFCEQLGFTSWFETSAKDNINIDESAHFLVEKILEMDKWSQEPASPDDKDKVDLNANGKFRQGGGSNGKCSC